MHKLLPEEQKHVWGTTTFTKSAKPLNYAETNCFELGQTPSEYKGLQFTQTAQFNIRLQYAGATTSGTLKIIDERFEIDAGNINLGGNAEELNFAFQHVILHHNSVNYVLELEDAEDRARLAHALSKNDLNREIMRVLEDPAFPEFVARVERLVALSEFV